MTARENYLVFSDVHLGADLVHHVRPWTLARLKGLARVDRELARMLDWYREHADPAHPWRLVIAGDLVDFIGMSISPHAEDGDADLSAEEREYGLGSTARHAMLKMRAVAERHRLVFEKLSDFVAAGHRLSLVRGNHDIDFHWDSARAAFLDALLVHRPELSAEARAAFAGRVEFFPWFFYVENLLYVEHGHQFDAMCSYHHLLAPVSPSDPKRICWSFSDILLRQVVRPTPGIGADGHEHRGIVEYVRFGLSLGVRGAARLFRRYALATWRALRRWRAHMDAKAARVKAEHEAHLSALSERMRIGREKLEALAALWPAPVTSGRLAVLRSMFLDRVFLAGLIAVALASSGALLPWSWALGIGATLLGLAAAYWVQAARARERDVDVRVHMHLAAANIAKLLPSRYVVMGHTHVPLATRVSAGVTYVNVGNWGHDEVDGAPGEEPPRTHFVLRWSGGEARAEFLRWEPGTGPVPAIAMPPTVAPPAPASTPARVARTPAADPSAA